MRRRQTNQVSRIRTILSHGQHSRAKGQGGHAAPRRRIHPHAIRFRGANRGFCGPWNLSPSGGVAAMPRCGTYHGVHRHQEETARQHAARSRSWRQVPHWQTPSSRPWATGRTPGEAITTLNPIGWPALPCDSTWAASGTSPSLSSDWPGGLDSNHTVPEPLEDNRRWEADLERAYGHVRKAPAA